LSKEGADLGDVDLDLAVVEVDAELATLDGHAVTRKQNVADNLTLVESCVGDINMNLSVDLVCEGDKELAASEGIESVVYPLFCEWMVYNSLSLSRLVNGGYELENIVVAVEVPPHCLSVVGVIATSESLLATIVEEGDAASSKCKSKGALKESVVTLRVKEAGIVMVVDEDTESVNVSETPLVGGPPVGDGAHGPAVHPDVLDCVVHWVVEEGSNVVLIVTDVAVVAIEGLTHLEHARCDVELFPEVLGHMGDGVDSNAVEAILAYEVLDPVLKVLAHVGVTLVEVRKSRKAAVFNLILVTPVVDVAIGVIVLRPVEGVD